MKQLLSLFLFLVPCLAWAQYPSNGNQKITLGEQTTADGLIYRGVLGDTALITPLSDTSAYIILDTANHRFYNYNRATNVWSVAGGGTSVTTFSAGSTGLTPSTATSGAVTLAGTLAVANGGTGATTPTAALNALLPTQSQSTTIGATLKSNGTNSYWDNFSAAGTVQDQSGNFYNTVAIGTQVWFKENLRTKKYRSGALIPVKTNTDTSTLVGQMYYYSNDSLTNYSIYGAYYNWMATQSSDSLCPIGYHVPTDLEWTLLYTFLGGSSVAGGKLKIATLKLWLSPNTGATNESGFTGLPAGFRDPSGIFSNITNYALFWTSSTSGSNAIAKDLNVGTTASNNNNINKSYAASIRCIKN